MSNTDIHCELDESFMIPANCEVFEGWLLITQYNWKIIERIKNLKILFGSIMITGLSEIKYISMPNLKYIIPAYFRK